MTIKLLLKGTYEEKLRCTFRLYHTNGDGFIAKEEMEDMAQSVCFSYIFIFMVVFKLYDLMEREDNEDSYNSYDSNNVSQLILEKRDGLISGRSSVSTLMEGTLNK